MLLKIRKIEVDCILGDLPREREVPQKILVDLEVETDGDAEATDRLEDTVDYVALAECVRGALVAAKCRMLERAAKVVADAVTRYDKRITSVIAAVTKAGAVPGIGSVTVEYAYISNCQRP